MSARFYSNTDSAKTWLPLRWFREWREHRALIGEIVVIDGKPYTVADYKADTLTVTETEGTE